MKGNQFIPLNISYLQKNNKDRTVLYLIVSFLIILTGVVITLKIHEDYFFIGFLGSTFFMILGSIISIHLGVLFFRKVALKEKELMRLYQELLDHSATTITDLWDIFAIEDNLVRYNDDTTRVFIKCEKGYAIGREPGHEETHYNKLRDFMNYILIRGYSIDYYNWHLVDANSKPLESLERNLRYIENQPLKEVGQELLKVCRGIEYGDESATVEYFVISANNYNDASYIASIVETACEFLQGSLYTDVKFCDANDVVEAIQTIYKIKGINLNEMLDSQSQMDKSIVVQILDIIKSEVKEENTENHDKELSEFMESLSDIKKQKSGRNLVEPLTKIFNKSNRKDTEDLDGEDYEEAVPIIIEEDEEYEVTVTAESDDATTNNLSENEYNTDIDDVDLSDDELDLSDDDTELSNNTKLSNNDNENDDLYDTLFEDIEFNSNNHSNNHTKNINNTEVDLADELFGDILQTSNKNNHHNNTSNDKDNHNSNTTTEIDKDYSEDLADELFSDIKPNKDVSCTESTQDLSEELFGDMFD